jgi:hypothetical protein
MCVSNLFSLMSLDILYRKLLIAIWVVAVCCISNRGLCDGLITHPEESYRVSVCVRSRNPEKGGQRSVLDYKHL